MAFEHREGSGSLFKNEKKTSENHPDYQGEIMISGNIFQLAAWIKPTKSGGKFMSLSAKVKAPVATLGTPATGQGSLSTNHNKQEEYAPGKAFDDFDDSAPF